MTLTPDDLAQIQAMISAAPTVGEGFPQPIVAGQNLLIPGIQSPNFSISGQTGWAIEKNGNAFFFNITATGTITSTTVVVQGTTGGVFVYSGVPANGNLICSMAGQSGTDAFGNAFPEGFGLTTGQIPGGLINAGTISTAQLAALAVNASKIAANTITTSQIAAAAGILGGQIAAATLTDGNMAAHTITAGSIAANTITAAQIAANTITAGQIAANTITAGQIAAGTITSTQILAGTITAADLISGIVVAGIVNATTITGAAIIADGSSGEILVYSSTPATGNLVTSVSAVAGTDGHSNAYPAGVSINGPAGDSMVGGVLGGRATWSFLTGATQEALPAEIQTLTSGSGATEVLILFIAGAKSTNRIDQVFIRLQSSTEDGTSGAAGGNLIYETAAGVQNILLTWGLGGIETFSTYAGDNNTYVPLSSTVVPSGPITVNQTTFSQQVFPTLTLGVGTYILEGQMIYNPNQAAGFAMFELGGGTAVASSMRIFFREGSTGNPAGITTAADITAFASAYSGATFGAVERFCEFRGSFTISTAGTLGLFAACGTAAGDTYSIRASGSYLRLSAQA